MQALAGVARVVLGFGVLRDGYGVLAALSGMWLMQLSEWTVQLRRMYRVIEALEVAQALGG
jgi:hypothetical protein